MAAEASENLVIEALVRMFKGISSERQPDKYLTTPKTVQRGFVLAGMALPRPVLLLQLAEWEDTPLMGQAHEAKVRVAVHMVVDMERGDEGLVRLARDLKYALALDETLGGEAMFARAISYSPQIEAMERTGFAVATMAIEAVRTWQHDAP